MLNIMNICGMLLPVIGTFSLIKTYFLLKHYMFVYAWGKTFSLRSTESQLETYQFCLDYLYVTSYMARAICV